MRFNVDKKKARRMPGLFYRLTPILILFQNIVSNNRIYRLLFHYRNLSFQEYILNVRVVV